MPFLNVNDVGERRLGRDPACLTASAETAERDNLVPHIPDVRELEAGIAQNVPYLAEKRANSVVPPIHGVTPKHRERRVPLHLDVEHSQEPFDVSALASVPSALEDLDVLLRHRPQYLAEGAMPFSTASGSRAVASPSRDLSLA